MDLNNVKHIWNNITKCKIHALDEKFLKYSCIIHIRVLLKMLALIERSSLHYGVRKSEGTKVYVINYEAAEIEL
jgi:hypothetical protein